MAVFEVVVIDSQINRRSEGLTVGTGDELLQDAAGSLEPLRLVLRPAPGQFYILHNIHVIDDNYYELSYITCVMYRVVVRPGPELEFIKIIYFNSIFVFLNDSSMCVKLKALDFTRLVAPARHELKGACIFMHRNSSKNVGHTARCGQASLAD